MSRTALAARWIVGRKFAQLGQRSRMTPERYPRGAMSSRPPDAPPRGWKVLLSTAFLLVLSVGAWWLIATARGTTIERRSLWVIAVSASLMLLLVAVAAVVNFWDWRKRARGT
jgi:hypothetical protein